MNTAHTSLSVAVAAILALGCSCATAQTAAAPAGSDAAGGNAPTRSEGTSPQNPSVNGYKDSKPDNSAGNKQRPQQDTTAAGALPSDPTSKDSMTKDNRPRHPAADMQKPADPK